MFFYMTVGLSRARNPGPATRHTQNVPTIEKITFIPSGSSALSPFTEPKMAPVQGILS